MAMTEAVSAGIGGIQRVAVEELGSHLATLEAELSDGKAIELVRGDKVVAELRAKAAPVAMEAEKAALPNFMARMKANWGDKVFPSGTGTRMIREDRDGRG